LKIPSSGYLAAAFGTIAASAILKAVGKDDWAIFVGQWPAVHADGRLQQDGQAARLGRLQRRFRELMEPSLVKFGGRKV
jgi:hypothetical protein